MLSYIPKFGGKRGFNPPVMLIILRSIPLSFGVAFSMILPAVGIYVAAGFLSMFFNTITGGLASAVSGPIAAAFLALYGIRVAQRHLGDNSKTDFQFLFLYAMMFAVILFLAKGIAVTSSYGIAHIFVDWQSGGALSLLNFTNADGALQRSLAFGSVGVLGVSVLVLTASAMAILAVPMANAARSAGQGARDCGIFFGPGKQFIPLFCIFAVVLFVQFFVGLIHFLLATVPLLLALFSLIVFQTLPDFDEKSTPRTVPLQESALQTPDVDIRALRKARQ